MRLKSALLLAVITVFIAGSTLAAETYTIDGAHSSISFWVRHMGLSKVRGNFGEFSGTVVYDAENPTKSSVSVTIKTASINTDNKGRDDHLRSKDFFEAEKYPEITFVSEKVEKIKDGMVAQGILTMHGVTKKIVLPFTLAGPIDGMRGEKRMGIETGLKLDRQEYGLAYGGLMKTGDLLIGNKITIDIELEVVNAAPEK